MARAQVAALMVMMLALAMLATTATAGPVDKLKGGHSNMRRRLHKLQTATMAQETCNWIYGDRYCPSGTQFNCCSGETSNKWIGCTVEDDNYFCPDNQPKAVCCRA